MDETSQKTNPRPAFQSEGSFKCYGFGFNGLRQITVNAVDVYESREVDIETDGSHPSAVLAPVQLNVDCVSSIVASWSSIFYLKGNFHD